MVLNCSIRVKNFQKVIFGTIKIFLFKISFFFFNKDLGNLEKIHDFIFMKEFSSFSDDYAYHDSLFFQNGPGTSRSLNRNFNNNDFHDWNEQNQDDWGAEGYGINLMKFESNNAEKAFFNSQLKNDNMPSSTNNLSLKKEESASEPQIKKTKNVESSNMSASQNENNAFKSSLLTNATPILYSTNHATSILNNDQDENKNRNSFKIDENCVFNFKENSSEHIKHDLNMKDENNNTIEATTTLNGKSACLNGEDLKSPMPTDKNIFDILPTPETDIVLKDLCKEKAVFKEENSVTLKTLEHENLTEIKAKNLNEEIFIEVPPCASASMSEKKTNLPRVSALLDCSTPKSTFNAKSVTITREECKELNITKNGDTSLSTSIGRKPELNASCRTLKVTKYFHFGSTYKCYISNVESPSLFFIQLKNKSDCIEKMGEKLK